MGVIQWVLGSVGMELGPQLPTFGVEPLGLLSRRFEISLILGPHPQPRPVGMGFIGFFDSGDSRNGIRLLHGILLGLSGKMCTLLDRQLMLVLELFASPIEQLGPFDEMFGLLLTQDASPFMLSPL